MKIFEKNISYLKNSPILIFKIDNFLEKEFFDQINGHFPKIDNSKLSLKDNFGKYTLNPKDYNFENLKQKEVISRFEKIIFSNDFFYFFVKKFFFKNVFSQKNLIRKIRYLRIPKLDENNNHFLLEVNTLPGMTPSSLLPKAAESHGMNFDELVETILKIALIDNDKVL